jgi:hypothetical protein
MRRWSPVAIAVAAAAVLAPAAYATDYTWTGGDYTPGNPSTLNSGDQLTITNTGASLFFNGTGTPSVLLTNNGTVIQTSSTVYFENAAVVDNTGTWEANGTGNSTLQDYSGGGAFNNTGVLSNIGTGTFAINTDGAFSFTDTGGTIDASGGAIVFSGSSVSFTNTSFTGAAGVAVVNGANFAGNISSSGNALQWQGGTINAAAPTSLTGGSAVNWQGGALSGSWTITNGATLTANTNGSGKFLNAATLTNNGTVNYAATDNLYFENASVFNNNSAFNITAATTIQDYSGGGTFTNNALFNNASGGTVNINTDGNLAFVNTAGKTITTSATSITNFNGGNVVFNDGTILNGGGAVNILDNATVNGALNVTGPTALTLVSGTLTGAATTATPAGATLNGTMDWNGGVLTGTWVIPNSSVLNVTTNGSGKFLNAATLTNNGTVNYAATDNLYFENASVFNNNSAFNITAATTIQDYSGGGTFTNNALFDNASGGTVNINTDGNLAFVNTAGKTITTSATSITNFNGGNVVFNDGTILNGGGAVNILDNATVNGALNVTGPTALTLVSGTLTGAATTATPAGATLNGTMDWNGGVLTGTWVIPNSSVLNVTTNGSGKFLPGVSLTNNGTVNYSATDNLYFESNATLANNGVFNVTAATTIQDYTGGGTFANNALFNNASGGTVNINTDGNFAFVNAAGKIITTSATSITNFNGGNVVFNDGTILNGGGAVNILDNATVNGALNVTGPTALTLVSGILTGAATTATPAGAALNGAMTWNGGSFSGSWVVANGSTLAVTTNGSGKFLPGVSLTNNGTVNYSATDTLYFESNATLTNNGVFNVTAPTTIQDYTGGGVFNNNGLFQQLGTAANATTTIVGDSAFTFNNNGVVQALSGTIALATNFTNSGTVAGTATIATPAGLTLGGKIAPGVFNAAGVMTTPGNLTIAGNLVQSSTGTLEIGMLSAANFGSLTVNGSLTTAAGTQLDVVCLNDCSIAAGQYLVATTTSSTAAELYSLVTTGFALGTPGSDFAINYSGDNVYLDIAAAVGGAPVPLPNGVLLFVSGLGGLLAIGRPARAWRPFKRLRPVQMGAEPC